MSGTKITTAIEALATVLDRLVREHRELDQMSLDRPLPGGDRLEVERWQRANDDAMFALERAIRALPAETVFDAMISLGSRSRSQT